MKHRTSIRWTRTKAGAAIAVAAALAMLGAGSAQAQGPTFTPVADTYSDASAATANFGTASSVQPDGSPLKKAYLKFNLGSTTPASAALRIYSNSDSENGVTVRAVADNSWTETGLNHNNAPAVGDVVASTGPIQAGNWYTVNISPLTSSGGVVSIALLTSGSKSISVSSRESGRSPQIVTPAPVMASTFSVTRSGTTSTYSATSTTPPVSYTGSLKTVVQNAVADVSRAGGGSVQFAAGDFDLGNSQWELYDMVGVRFEGAGQGATVIRNNMSTTSFDTEPFDVASAWRVVIRDMTVNAGGPARSTSDVIDFDGGNDSIVERVTINQSRGRGVVFDGKDVVAGIKRTADNNVLRDCTINGLASDGVELLAASRNRVENCTITNTGGHGIQITKGSASAGQPNKKSNENLLIGNVIDQAGLDGINLNAGDHNEIRDNLITNSADDASSRDGIRLGTSDSQTCDDTIVTGNTATDTQTTKTQRYGLAITSSLCHRTVVFGNTFLPNRTGDILNQGTDTQFGPSSTDDEPPTTPQNLSVDAVSHDRVDLSWDQSTDNVSVAGYTIYRNGELLDTVNASVLSYADTSVAPLSHYTYAVDAVDAAGNHSGLSNAVDADTPDGPATLSFVPTADTYVNQSSPTSNYGNSDTLRTDGDPLVHAYLRFQVANVNGTITKATLRIHANTSSNQGFGVRTVSNNTWTEGGLTFANQPGFAGTGPDSLPFGGGSDVEVDVTSLITGNGTYNLALIGLGSTAVSYASRSTTLPPTLTIEEQ